MIPDEKRKEDEYIFSEGYMFVYDFETYKRLDTKITIDFNDKDKNDGFTIYSVGS